MAQESTQPLTEMSIRNILAVKVAGAYGGGEMLSAYNMIVISVE
jgi:hypothetical protein